MFKNSRLKKKNKKINKFENLYIKILETSLKKQKLNFFIIFIIIFFIIILYEKISKELAPREDRGVFIMVMESPEGSTFENTVEYITEFGKKLLHSKPSMLQDVEAKKLCEIDAINGMVVTLGEKNNIKTPYNSVVTSLIKAQELKY